MTTTLIDNNNNKLVQEHKQIRRKQEQTAKKQQQQQDFRPVTFYINLKDSDTEFFQKYGILTSKLLYRDTNDVDILSTGMKGYFDFGTDRTKQKITETKAFKKLLSNSTVVFPHQEVGYHLHKMVDNFNKFGNSGEFGDLKLVHEYDSHRGFTHFWKFMSDKKHAVQKGDLVQFGMQFRNGIGTNISLGGDFFSYRLSCLNGAVARDKRFSFNIPHRISTSYMVEHLTDALSNIIQNYKQLLEYYRAFTKIKLNQQMVLRIIKKAEIPVKHLNPALFDITLPSEENTLKHAFIRLSKHGKESTMWDLFNSITDPLTRSMEADRSTKTVKKIAYSSFADRTAALHRAMFLLAEVQIRK